MMLQFIRPYNTPHFFNTDLKIKIKSYRLVRMFSTNGEIQKEPSNQLCKKEQKKT